MSGEERCAREGCSARLYGRDGYCSISCEDLHRTEKERDEALAEVERLRRGIEAYRAAWIGTNNLHYDREVKAWEREDKNRKESGDDAP